MRDTLYKILENEPDKFKALSRFYREKNSNGYGLFSTLAGETFPDGWIKAINDNHWEEQGIYGDNFRETFNIKH
jgi:hypothetical protein